MKLNYRDKVIFGIGIAILILVVGFFFLIKPKNEEIKEDEKTLIAKQEEEADLKARIAKIEPLKNSIDEVYGETAKLTADFVPIDDINESQKLDQYMQHLAEEAGVRIDELNVSYPKEQELDYYYLEYEDLISDMRNSADLNGGYAEAYDKVFAEQNALEQRNVETLIQTQYGIRVTGTREAVWAYMKAVQELKKTLLINQVDITDYSFGADKEDAEQQPTVDENAEEPAVTDENAEAPEEAGAETDTPEPAPAPEELTIDDANTSTVQIVISLYSVYDMQKPDTAE
ncbi:MAG: hypothetical protein K2K14_04365 [Ruminococcus sp.]|nr:hypothetical protein [Ruminococcus sp.]